MTLALKDYFVGTEAKTVNGGRIAAFTKWPYCGDHRVASLRRSLNGSMAPIINSHGKVSPRMRLKSLPALSFLTSPSLSVLSNVMYPGAWMVLCATGI